MPHKVSLLLQNIGLALDITESQYHAVIERYTAVANYLAEQDSLLSPYKPDIKPQGSFLLGTMIKPVVEDDELDVDLVCRLHGKNADWTQKSIKNAVGDQLKMHEAYKHMMDTEGNRCWTLIYQESAKFHMDILPAIVGQNHFTLLEKSFSTSNSIQVEQIALRITDKRRPDYSYTTDPQQWLKSNPFGYAAWFRERATTVLSKSFSLRETVEPLPGYERDKEPLVRVVQILKRHRDIMFTGDPCKPISIIITTLAARSYNKETDLLLAINNVLKSMDSFIEERYCQEHQRIIKWISNPVNDKENFADRWLHGKEGVQRERQFYEWLKKARIDFDRLNHHDITHAYLHCKALLGTKAVIDANQIPR